PTAQRQSSLGKTHMHGGAKDDWGPPTGKVPPGLLSPCSGVPALGGWPFQNHFRVADCQWPVPSLFQNTEAAPLRAGRTSNGTQNLAQRDVVRRRHVRLP